MGHPYRKHAVKPKASALWVLPFEGAAPPRLRVVGFKKRKGEKWREEQPSTVTSLSNREGWISFVDRISLVSNRITMINLKIKRNILLKLKFYREQIV